MVPWNLLETSISQAKRFGLKGCEALLPALWALTEKARHRESRAISSYLIYEVYYTYSYYIHIYYIHIYIYISYILYTYTIIQYIIYIHIQIHWIFGAPLGLPPVPGQWAWHGTPSAGHGTPWPAQRVGAVAGKSTNLWSFEWENHGKIHKQSRFFSHFIAWEHRLSNSSNGGFASHGADDTRGDAGCFPWYFGGDVSNSETYFWTTYWLQTTKRNG